MDKQTVDIYIAKTHFRIRHKNAEYVKLVAKIVDDKIRDLSDENVGVSTLDNAILTCLDICDDLLASQKQVKSLEEKSEELNKSNNALLEENRALDVKNRKLNERIAYLEREVEYFKNPKFVIPSPISKPKVDISAGQLCFPFFENRPSLEPAVNGLSVANIRKTSKRKSKV